MSSKFGTEKIHVNFWLAVGTFKCELGPAARVCKPLDAIRRSPWYLSLRLTLYPEFSVEYKKKRRFIEGLLFHMATGYYALRGIPWAVADSKE